MDNNYLKYKKYKAKYLEATKLKMLTPATLFKLFENSNIAIVNTLKNNYLILKNPAKREHLSLFKTAEEFEQIVNSNSITSNTFDLIVFYCANYTCSAAKNYASKIFASEFFNFICTPIFFKILISVMIVFGFIFLI